MKYTVYFQANVGQASDEIEADNPELAILAARQLALDDMVEYEMDFDDSDHAETNVITVFDANGQHAAEWVNPDELLRQSAPLLLEWVTNVIDEYSPTMPLPAYLIAEAKTLIGLLTQGE